ncbi:MAG: hypothetical protein HYY15_03795 [Candidatus Omnitrophica bacterium]|nr:hypothetical protein [Candidatus Omnitrophota bacterium]
MELFIAVAIFSGIIGAVFVSFLIGQRSFRSSEAFIQVQQEARRALDNMVKELREAGGTITGPPTELRFQVALGYNLPPPCPVNDVCWGATDSSGTDQPNWSIRYRLTGAQLRREVLDTAGATRASSVLGNDVSQLTFAYIGGNTQLVTIDLQVQQVSSQLPGGSMSTGTTPLRTQVRLRNPS